MSPYEVMSLLLNATGIFISALMTMLVIIVTLIIALVNRK